MRWLPVTLVALILVPEKALAQTDEIQVYDGTLAKPGVFNLTLHTNFTPSGLKEPAFPGAVVADQSLNGVPEWAYGVKGWLELGLYLPLFTRDKDQGWGLDGFKLRALFAVPNAGDRRFFYGANFEFSYNAKRWDQTRITSEIRPIIGWHLHPVDIIFNPILDTSYDGIRNLDFAPCTRLAYNLSTTWAVAIEEYADLGHVSGLNTPSEQAHQVYGVVDYRGKSWDVETGIGFGLTKASDDITIKLSVSHDLNKTK